MSEGNVLPLISKQRINEVVSTLKPTKNHQRLLKALEKSFNHHFVLMGQDGCESYYESVRDGHGTLIHDRYVDWLRALYKEHREDVDSVFQYLRECPFSITKKTLKSVYVALPLSDIDSSQFFQIEIQSVIAEKERCLLSDIERPYGLDCIEDLLNPNYSGYLNHPRDFTDGLRYQFESQVRFDSFVYKAGNIDRVEHQRFIENPPIVKMTRSDSQECKYVPFLDLHPELAKYHACGTVRWVADWYRSSAQKEPPYRHWYFEFIDSDLWQNPPPERTLYFIPQWLSTKKLPEIRVKSNDTIHSLLARLEALDNKVGCPFAWYFFMLHGNRVEGSPGKPPNPPNES